MKTKKHKEKCKVCNSPNRKAIERDYINGLSLREIEVDYPELGKNSMWNHLNAYPSLRKKRSENIEAVIDRIIEHGAIGSMKIDGHLVLKAAQTKLKVQGKLRDSGGQGDLNVQVNVIQEGKEQVQKNRRLAFERLGYTNSDN